MINLTIVLIYGQTNICDHLSFSVFVYFLNLFFRFTPSPDIFTSTPTKNTCFCSKISDKEVTKTTCPPSGVFNGSACSFGLPIITSFPHFYAGDSILRENIDGLNPQKELHQSSVEIHPVTTVILFIYFIFHISLLVRLTTIKVNSY